MTTKLLEAREAYFKQQKEAELAANYPALQAAEDEAARQSQAKQQADIVRGKLNSALSELEAAKPNRDEAIKELIAMFKNVSAILQNFNNRQTEIVGDKRRQMLGLTGTLAHWEIESRPAKNGDKWDSQHKSLDILQREKGILQELDLAGITRYQNYDASALAAEVLSLLSGLGLLNSATNSGQSQGQWHQRSDGVQTVK